MSDVVELLREHKSHVNCDWAGRVMQEAEEAILELQDLVSAHEYVANQARMVVEDWGDDLSEISGNQAGLINALAGLQNPDIR